MFTQFLYQPQPRVYLAVYTENDTVQRFWLHPIDIQELRDVPISYEIPIYVKKPSIFLCYLMFKESISISISPAYAQQILLQQVFVILSG